LSELSVDPVFNKRKARKLESRNSREMKRVYELDVYKPAEALSDMLWHDFDKWNKKVQNIVA